MLNNLKFASVYTISNGYDVGVDYHSTGADFVNTAFLNSYDLSSVRETVKSQLQGIADKGATFVSTRIWLVSSPGAPKLNGAYQSTFPLSDKQRENLRAYANDVAGIQGVSGNRLRLTLCLLYLGYAEYTTGNPSTGLGYYKDVTASEFTARVERSTDQVLNAIQGVRRPDGVSVVDRFYLNGEVMVGAKPNEDWFLATHYPRFVSVVKDAGFVPSIYFNASMPQDYFLRNDYVDVDYHPILNNHISMFWVYRSLKFMVDHNLQIPDRIDFSLYVNNQSSPPPTQQAFNEIIQRVFDDADATLPSLGAPRAYAVAETLYYTDPLRRNQFASAYGAEGRRSGRLKSLSFWTTPDSGGPGNHAAFPFAIEDYLPAH
jgi:hypothetical protein